MAKHRLFIMRIEPCGCLFEMLGRPEGVWKVDLHGAIKITCPHSHQVTASQEERVVLKEEP